MSGKKQRKRSDGSNLVPILTLCILGIIAYGNSFDVPFVFDDYTTLEQNSGVRFGIYLSNSLLWTRSLLYVTFALNHQFAGMEVWSYHAVNLLLHLLNGILLYVIARHIFERIGAHGARLIAIVASAFFLLHPVQTESVTYISSRSELLSTFFYALAVLVFIRWPERKIGFGLAGLITVLFICGLGSKEVVISLPASLFLYDFVFLSRGSLRPLLTRWRFYVVFAGMGVIAAASLLGQWLRTFSPDPTLLSPWLYLLTQFRVMVRYLQLLVAPVGLNLDYDFRPSASLLEPAVLLSLIVLIVLAGAAYYWRRTQPVLAFSVFWFFITLAPTSSVVPIQDVIFEHRLYLPMLGISLFFPIAVQLVIQRLGVSLEPVYFSWLLIAALLVGTIARNNVWRDEARLYSDIVAKSPEKPRGYLALATHMRGRDPGKAISVVRAGLERIKDRKNQDVLHTVLGNLYMDAGQHDRAAETFTTALDNDDSAMAYNNLGAAYLAMWYKLEASRQSMGELEYEKQKNGILTKARTAFWESYRRDPTLLSGLDSYVTVRYYEGAPDKVRSEFQAQLQNKEDFEALYSLGRLEFNARNWSDANKYFERAGRFRSQEKLLLFNHGMALSQLNQVNAAIDKYLQAIRVDPTFKEAYHNLGMMYLRTAEIDKAIIQFDEVLRLDRQFVPTLVAMAKIFIDRKEDPRARTYLQEVLTTNPQHQEALALWQKLIP